MVRFENAHVIEAEELKELIEEDYSNPTIDRMMFIETKQTEKMPGKVFPCFVVAYGQEENAEMKVDPGLRFRMYIAQSANGEFGLVEVIIMANELGITKRIWDKPPTKGLSENIPWVALEGEVQ